MYVNLKNENGLSDALALRKFEEEGSLEALSFTYKDQVKKSKFIIYELN